MKAKHLLNSSLPLSQQTYDELRKGLILGHLKWKNFSRRLKNAYHNFSEEVREMDFEKRLHKGNTGKYDYETPI